jgi:hypothetical protein
MSDTAKRLRRWEKHEVVGGDCFDGANEIERLRKLADDNYDSGFRVGIEKAPSYKENQELRDEIECLQQMTKDAAQALNDEERENERLRDIATRFYKQCKDAGVWFPMDQTLMRDAKDLLDNENT